MKKSSVIPPRTAPTPMVDDAHFQGFRVAVVALICGVVALVGCGSSGEESDVERPTSTEMVNCLKDRGAMDVQIEDRLVLAQTVEGDAIFILDLPNRALAERASEGLREAKRKAGLGGIMLTSAVNKGFTLIGVIGQDGVDGGVPARRSESLAHECATRPFVSSQVE